LSNRLAVVSGIQTSCQLFACCPFAIAQWHGLPFFATQKLTMKKIVPSQFNKRSTYSIQQQV